MKKTVKIVHPTAGESEVFELAVPAWRAAGWTPADEVENEAQADAGQSSGEQATSGEPSGEQTASGDQAAPEEPKSGARPRRRTNEEGK